MQAHAKGVQPGWIIHSVADVPVFTSSDFDAQMLRAKQALASSPMASSLVVIMFNTSANIMNTAPVAIPAPLDDDASVYEMGDVDGAVMAARMGPNVTTVKEGEEGDLSSLEGEDEAANGTLTDRQVALAHQWEAASNMSDLEEMTEIIHQARLESSSEVWNGRVEEMEEFLSRANLLAAMEGEEEEEGERHGKSLTKLLEDAQLTSFESALRGAGMRVPSDIEVFSMEDLRACGMNKIQVHRLQRYYRDQMATGAVAQPAQAHSDYQALTSSAEAERQQMFMLQQGLTEEALLERANSESHVRKISCHRRYCLRPK